MTILFRADAAPAIGTGHVMRCLAVAEALRDNGAEAVFAMADSTPAIDARLDGAGFRRMAVPGPAGGNADRDATLGLLQGAEAEAVVLDGYRFAEAYRAAVRGAGRPVLSFDDTAELTAFHADLIVNASPTAPEAVYRKRAPGAVLLLGAAHVCLRRDLRAALAAPRLPLVARDALLVTFGGSDPARLTVPCLEGLAAALPGVRLVAAVGGSHPEAGAVARAAERLGAEVHVDSPRMGTLMAGAGLAVSAAGGTIGELAAFGIPTVLVAVADNQAGAAGMAAAMGWCAAVDAAGPGVAERIVRTAAALWHDPPRRAAMAALVEGRVDGGGAARIAAALLARVRGP